MKKEHWNTIPNLPQNLIMQRIRDIARRKTRARFIMYYARHANWWAELQMHNRGVTNRQMICSVSLMNGVLRYSSVHGAVGSDVKLPSFENPKFNPDAVAACLVAIYKRWYEVEVYARESFWALGDESWKISSIAPQRPSPN